MNNVAVSNVLLQVFNNNTYLSNFFKFRINNPQFDFAQAMQIFANNPEVTICKTFDEWNAIKRRIIWQSKAISYTDNENPNIRHHVFDISQTQGVDYPPIVYEQRKNLVLDLNELN